MRKRMGLHHQPRTFLMEPPATISIARLHEVHRPVMLGRPSPSSILCTDASTSTMLPGRSSGAIRRSDMPSTPSKWLHFSTIRDKNSVRRGSNAGSNLIGIRSDVGAAIRCVWGTGADVPSWNTPRWGRRTNERGPAGSTGRGPPACTICADPAQLPVLNIGQPANMDNEVGTSSARRQFVTGALHITIGESESLAGWPQTKTGKHQFLGS